MRHAALREEILCNATLCVVFDPRPIELQATQERHASARELADDLDRWLEGRPITSRPVGTVTRVFPWCKRQPLVAGLAASLLISAVAGSAGVIVNWLEVRRQRDQVRVEWENARILNEFLTADLLALTDLAIIAYDQGFIAHDKGRICEAVATLNDLTVAETRVFGVDHPETIFVRARLGAALLGTKADAPTLGIVLSSDANTLWELGHLAEAEKASVEAVEILRKISRPSIPSSSTPRP
jgi:hypothetical protein